MLYHLIRPLARIALNTYFRKVHFAHAERIPQNQPVILAVNHPTAFIEPCLLAVHQGQDLRFIVRGDIFVKPFYTKLLLKLKMLPIYRFHDGFSKLRTNESTFNICYDALEAKEMIMILAEGRTIMEKRLRPIQKGTARMAFGTIKKHGTKGISIVPVGVNYTDANEFRSQVMIEFGEPIWMDDYLPVFEKNENKAVRQVTMELEKQMGSHLIIIDEFSDEALVESLFRMYRNEQVEKYLPIVEKRNDQLHAEKQIAHKINNMSMALKTSLQKMVETYEADLKKNKLEDFGLAQPQHHRLWNYLQVIWGFVPFIIGYVGNYIPMKIATYIAHTRTNSLEFNSSVKIGVGLGVYPIYWLLLFLIAVIFGNWFWIILVFLLPLFGKWTLYYMKMFADYNAARKVRFRPKAVLEDLHQQRKKIQQTINSFESILSE